jgi:hypothetical protein
MIGNFDTALTAFEHDVHEGKANVEIVPRSTYVGHGGGAIGAWELVGLLGLAALPVAGRLQRAHNGATDAGSDA